MNMNISPIKLEVTAMAIGALVLEALKFAEIADGGGADGSSARLIAPSWGCIDMVSCEMAFVSFRD